MTVTRTSLLTAADDRCIVITWSGLLTTDLGEAAQMGRFYDLTVQVIGTFGSGGTVQIKGSNDGGTTWGRLHDRQGVLISIGDSNPIALQDAPALIRPDIISGDGTTSLKVAIAGAIRSF